jgi:hypothetical protein
MELDRTSFRLVDEAASSSITVKTLMVIVSFFLFSGGVLRIFPSIA